MIQPLNLQSTTIQSVIDSTNHSRPMKTELTRVWWSYEDLKFSVLDSPLRRAISICTTGYRSYLVPSIRFHVNTLQRQPAIIVEYYISQNRQISANKILTAIQLTQWSNNNFYTRYEHKAKTISRICSWKRYK